MKNLKEESKVLFVINSKSGNNVNHNLEHLITEQRKKSGFEFRIHQMSGKNASAAIKNAIDEYKPDIVAACGGDGTVNLVSTLLLNTKICLLIVPHGSANGMAKEIQIDSIEKALSLLENGVQKRIDTLEINGRNCIHLADVGLNARIVKRFENDARRGILTYAKHLFAEVFLLKQYRFKIKYCNTTVSRTAVSVTFANASKYGTGAVINAMGKLDDGKFEIVIVKPFPNMKLLSIAWKMFNGKLQTSEYVEVIRCTDAFVTCNKKTTFQIDGEIIGKIKEFDIKVLPLALTILEPEDLG